MNTKPARANRSLVIVSKRQPRLYASVKQLLASYRHLQIILDRRRGERRERTTFIEADRRRADRRARRDVDENLAFRGWTMVRQHGADSGEP